MIYRDGDSYDLDEGVANSDAANDQKAKQDGMQMFEKTPMLVKNLNKEVGVEWQITCTVNKKHPIKTHAKG